MCTSILRGCKVISRFSSLCRAFQESNSSLSLTRIPKYSIWEAIQEHVPVFQGKFRISQDLTVTPSRISDGLRAVFSKERTISITGDLRYEACDQRVCYPPTSVPVTWQLQILPLDLKRSPKVIQHK